MDRRAFIATAAGLLVAPFDTEAQPAGKVPRIGILLPGAPPPNSPGSEAFRQGLRELGYLEGQNILVERRYAGGRVEGFAGLAGELVRLKVDVIVAAGPMIQAAMKATDTIPIVMSAAPDPVAQGFVVSLARPGRNVTGLSLVSPELAGKLLQLLKEAVPKASRVGLLSLRGAPATVKETKVTARALGLQTESLDVGGPEALSQAFETAMRARVDALVIFPGVLGVQYRASIVELATKHRLPALAQFPEFAEAGGLMSYGASLTERWHRAATYVDKILKGAKPGDLPIEQPTKFELVINLKTAKALGLMIPQSLLLRADQVIQ